MELVDVLQPQTERVCQHRELDRWTPQNGTCIAVAVTTTNWLRWFSLRFFLNKTVPFASKYMLTAWQPPASCTLKRDVPTLLDFFPMVPLPHLPVWCSSTSNRRHTKWVCLQIGDLLDKNQRDTKRRPSPKRRDGTSDPRNHASRTCRRAEYPARSSSAKVS